MDLRQSHQRPCLCNAKMKLNQNRHKNSGHLMVLLDSYFKSKLSLIVRVNVVLNRTVVVDRVRVRVTVGVIITIFL